MSKKTRRTIFILIVCSFAISWFLFQPGFLNSWSLRGNDLLFMLRYRLPGKVQLSPYVVHLNIDNASIKELGTSVESADRYRKIIDILSKAGVSSIIFDMVILKSESGLEQFAALANAVEKSGRVYFPVILKEPADNPPDSATQSEAAPIRHIWKIDNRDHGSLPSSQVSFITSPELTDKAKGIGHINCPPDEDGVFRRYPLVMKYDSGFVPSVAFRTVCDFLSVKEPDIEISPGSHIILHNAVLPDGRKKDIRIPVDSNGRIVINFPGPWSTSSDKSFAMYNLNRIYEADRDGEVMDRLTDAIEEKIVIVADISSGKDSGPVPLDRLYRLPGLHSSVINSILTCSFVRELPGSAMLLVDTILIVLLCLTAFRFKALWYAVFSMLIIAGLLLSAIILFLKMGILMNTVRSGAATVLAFTSVSICKYLLEEWEKTLLRSRFESYFSPSMLNKILKTPRILDLRQKKVITVLFSDISGFTSWSASKRPEEIHSILNEYFREMTAIVFKYDGTVDKYIGDGLMAFFGDPAEYPDHALRAVKAAIEMQLKTRELKQKWEPEGRMVIKIRIGINTGEAVVGNMGSEKRVNYTAIGANVNLAQRLESAAPIEGILISESVYETVNGSVTTKPVGKIKVKGFDKEIAVYEVPVGH